MKIKEMMQEQRPREKALRLGIESLSDTELLCLIISSGTKNRPVDVIAEDLLKKPTTYPHCPIFRSSRSWRSKGSAKSKRSRSQAP
ncbi:UPF0758 domain-containing protein [Dubosiella newyorkensis]|uniref:UPF0758 domain-containing protein n=1 Tax=Dubosiella newyorkensis TaxID=1862672 RepID=UPI003516DE32